MNVDTIVSALGGRRGMAPCPCHDDKNASLAVSNKNGKVLVFCHAGCAQEDVVAELKDRGLWPSPNDDNPRPRWHDNDEKAAGTRPHKIMDILRSAAENDERPEEYLRRCRKIDLIPSNARMLSARDARRLTGLNYPAVVFPITNERHELLAASVTFLTADASENLTGRGGNIRRMYGPVTGGFVRLGASKPGQIDPDRPLIVGEGIETVLAAAQISGLSHGVAALSAGNLKVITPPPCSAILIAADNDKAGREAANALAERLNTPERPVSIIYPPERGDWNDELRESDDLDALKELFERARPEPASTNKTFAVGMTTFMSIQFPKRLNLLRPWLTTSGIAMLYAEAGVGKTRLALSIGYAVASEQSLMDWQCEQRAKVLLVDGEMPGELLQQWIDTLGPTLPDEDFLILSHAHLDTLNKTMPDLGQEAGREFLDRIIEEKNIGLIILDSISMLVRSGVENEAESWRVIQDWSVKHRLRGRSVLFLHHAGRSGKMRGTTMREASPDTTILLKSLPDESTDTATAVELSFQKSRGFFGKDAATRIVRFTTANGQIDWTSELKTGEQSANVEAVADMLDRGMKQSEIAAKLGLHKSRISQIVKGIRMRTAPEGEDSEV